MLLDVYLTISDILPEICACPCWLSNNVLNAFIESIQGYAQVMNAPDIVLADIPGVNVSDAFLQLHFDQAKQVENP